jgi:SOS-response transcriptional repressor LexA
MSLTEKQKNLLDYIKNFIDIKGRKPTQRECAAYFNVTQPAIYKLLKILRIKGYTDV